MVPTVQEAFCVKERDPTMFRIYADLFDDKALTSIKDCLAYSNILCLLHGPLPDLVAVLRIKLFHSRRRGRIKEVVRKNADQERNHLNAINKTSTPARINAPMNHPNP
jgi:hypothetical protein